MGGRQFHQPCQPRPGIPPAAPVKPAFSLTFRTGRAAVSSPAESGLARRRAVASGSSDTHEAGRARRARYGRGAPRARRRSRAVPDRARIRSRRRGRPARRPAGCCRCGAGASSPSARSASSPSFGGRGSSTRSSLAVMRSPSGRRQGLSPARDGGNASHGYLRRVLRRMRGRRHPTRRLNAPAPGDGSTVTHRDRVEVPRAGSHRRPVGAAHALHQPTASSGLLGGCEPGQEPVAGARRRLPRAGRAPGRRAVGPERVDPPLERGRARHRRRTSSRTGRRRRTPCRSGATPRGVDRAALDQRRPTRPSRCRTWRASVASCSGRN